MALGAKALGRLAIPGGTLTQAFVEYEVKQALEWLQGDRNENRRYASVYILRELSMNAPTMIYAYVPQILDLIWVPMRDAKVPIREASRDALVACMRIIYQRESPLRHQWYTKIVDEAQRGLKLGNADAIHASLITYSALMQEAGMVRMSFP